MRDLAADHSPLALNTATLGHNLEGHGAGWAPERVIDACAERGFGAISWWRREPDGRAAAIGERTRAAGLAVSGLCRTPFLVGPLAPPTRQAVLDDCKAGIDMAADLRAPCLTVCTGGLPPGERDPRRGLDAATAIVAELAPLARAAGTRLALEPLHPLYAADRSCLVTLRDALDICDALDHPALAVAVDVYHVWWNLDLATQIARAGAGRLAGFHICDWLPRQRHPLLDRGMMGDGVADIRGIRRAMEAAGYAGFCEVEIYSSEDWWQRDPGEVLDVCVERFRAVC